MDGRGRWFDKEWTVWIIEDGEVGVKGWWVVLLYEGIY